MYLLDDPLSAVDGEVGWHIFKWAIKTGLRHATVVLVTHQLQVVGAAVVGAVLEAVVVVGAAL